MIHLILLLAILATASPDTTALLPGDGTPDGWSPSGSASLYEGGALFDHINGGADAYHDRGFERLVVQIYSKGDAEVQLEIYDMGSPTGAGAKGAAVVPTGPYMLEIPCRRRGACWLLAPLAGPFPRWGIV